jgi:hypothetical protein
MKKLLVLILLFVTSYAQAEQWVKLSQEYGGTFFYDASSLKRTGTNVEFQIKLVMEPPIKSIMKDGKDTIASINRQRIDCKKHMMYSDHHEKIYADGSKYIGDDFGVEVNPTDFSDSPGGKLDKQFCHGR